MNGCMTAGADPEAQNQNEYEFLHIPPIIPKRVAIVSVDLLTRTPLPLYSRGGGFMPAIHHYQNQYQKQYQKPYWRSLIDWMRSGALRNLLHLALGILVIATIGFGVKQATRSSLFILKSVVVEPLRPGYPLTRETVLELAKVPLGSKSLFDLNLAPVELRLLRHPWVKGVIVGKQFPNTLSLKIVERDPVALLTEGSGRVLYLESDGGTFEDEAMVYPGDLPILSGFSAKNVDLLKRLNGFIQTWFAPENLPGLKLSSISYDEKMGLRAMISYPLKNQHQMRTILELGLNLEEASAIPVSHLRKVLEYVANRAQPASRSWLGDGKKIVVKISGGS